MAVKNSKSTFVAYLTWLVLGIFGVHRLYLGRPLSGLAQFIWYCISIYSLSNIEPLKIPMIIAVCWWLIDGYNVGKYLKELKAFDKMMMTYSEDVAQLNQIKSQYLACYKRRDYAQALVLSHQALVLAEKTTDTEDKVVAEILNDQGEFYRLSGEYVKAELVLKRAINICENLAIKDFSLFNMMNSLALVYSENGQRDAAISLFDRTLKMVATTLGEKSSFYVRLLNNLAVQYENENQSKKAFDLFEQALQLADAIPDFDQPLLLDMLNNYASKLVGEKKYEYAMKLYKRAIVIQEASHNTLNPTMAFSLNGLGVLYYNCGQLAEAEPYLKRALFIRETTLGSSHPVTMLTRYSLMDVQKDLQQHSGTDQNVGVIPNKKTASTSASLLKEPRKHHMEMKYLLINQLFKDPEKYFFYLSKGNSLFIETLWEEIGKKYLLTEYVPFDGTAKYYPAENNPEAVVFVLPKPTGNNEAYFIGLFRGQDDDMRVFCLEQSSVLPIAILVEVIPQGRANFGQFSSFEIDDFVKSVFEIMARPLASPLMFTNTTFLNTSS